MCLGRIAAHDDLGLGIANIIEAVGHRAVAPSVGYARNRRRMADTRLMVGVVGAPERAEFAEQIGAFIGHLGRPEPVDGIAARLFANLQQLVADLVDRGVPGDARPLPVDELHGIAKSPVAVHELTHRSTLRTMRAAIDRRLPARFLPNPDPVQHFRGHRASNRAMRADALADSRARSERPRGRSLRLADAAYRQRAQRCESAAGKTGSAKKSAPIETAALSRQGLRD